MNQTFVAIISTFENSRSGRFPARCVLVFRSLLAWERKGDTPSLLQIRMSVIAGRSVREAGVCSDRHSIFVVGGKPDDMAAYRFDVSVGLWTTLPEMTRPRRCAGKC